MSGAHPPEGTSESAVSGTGRKVGALGAPPKRPFRELFSRDELWHYGSAAAIYIILGILFQELVLNWIVGPLFIVLWMWWAPPLVEKWRKQRS